MHLLVIKGLGVRQPDFRSFSAGNGKDGIGCRQRFPIEKEMKAGSRRHRDRLLGKLAPVRLFIGRSVDSHNFSGAGRREFHVRQRIRNQAPVIVSGRIGRVSTIHRGIHVVAHGSSDGYPVCICVGCRMPIPIVEICINLLPRTGSEIRVEVHRTAIERAMTRLDFDLPLFRSRDPFGAGGFALQQKCRSIAHLSDWRKDAPVPHRCRDQVAACVQQRSQVEALVAPVAQVAACGSVAHPAAIHIENESIVGTYAHWIARGNGSKLERTPEVQNQGLAQWSSRVCDPGGMPGAVRRIRLLRRDCRPSSRRTWRLGVTKKSRSTTNGDEKKAEGTAHNCSLSLLLYARARS